MGNAAVDKVAFGIAGWSYADWAGVVYPERTRDQLAYISRFVDVIEINNSFYRPPTARNSVSWLRRTEDLPNFFFTAKLHQDITHAGKLEPEMVRQFRQGYAPLRDARRLKHLLAQFRYDFTDAPAQRRLLRMIADAFGEDDALVFELRHKSWERDEALRFLETLDVTVCNLDYPVSYNGFSLPVCPVGRQGYFRLHGRNATKWFSKATRDERYEYDYSAAELEQIRHRVEKLAETAESVTVIANNHYRGGEVANVLELKAMMTGRPVAAPPGLPEAYPRLKRYLAED